MSWVFFLAPKQPPQPPPTDPGAEQQQQLYEQFRLLCFTESEARQLAAAWADPKQISWWLEQGCSHRIAVKIAT